VENGDDCLTVVNGSCIREQSIGPLSIGPLSGPMEMDHKERGTATSALSLSSTVVGCQI
jgi:hypothetical protein